MLLYLLFINIYFIFQTIMLLQSIKIYIYDFTTDISSDTQEFNLCVTASLSYKIIMVLFELC